MSETGYDWTHELVIAGGANAAVGLGKMASKLDGGKGVNNHSTQVLTSKHRASDIATLLSATQSLADQIASRPNTGNVAPPLDDLRRLASLGLFTAPLPLRNSGLGLGTEPDGHLALLRVMTMLGGADLVLGRLFEGHANALILITSYGSDAQISRAAEDARKGLLFGVWNTGAQEPVCIAGSNATYTFKGSKTFATGAAFVNRPIVTGELSTGGWQMTLPRMESSDVKTHLKIDRGFWEPLGMEASESFAIDFTGAALQPDDLIGNPGDFYRDPLFRGGAIRFAAVHAGAVLRLHRLFAAWLQGRGRGNDPYQIARLGEVALASQEAILWIERAAGIAEKCMSVRADKLATERMVDCANMTRVAVEKIATRTMQLVIAGVGAHGLLRPSPFERLIRDLTMYLRQPAPDQALADVGRASLRKSNLRADGVENDAWRGAEADGSLPPSYFKQVYQGSKDPWNFESSAYEAEKYHSTLESLPLQRYRNVLEIGCSIGIFTLKLARRCDQLLGLDVSDKALELARDRCMAEPNVHFKRMQVPREMPVGCFDLVVVSEVAYYWSKQDLDRAAERIAQLQPTGAHLILVHYTAPVPDYPLTADEVHETWLKKPEWRSVKQERHDGYRLDVLERQASSSVCQ